MLSMEPGQNGFSVPVEGGYMRNGLHEEYMITFSTMRMGKRNCAFTVAFNLS